MPLFLLFLLLGRSHSARTFGPFYVAVWGLLALQRIPARVLIYWDILPDGLHERRFWSQRTVAWSEIVSVTPWPSHKPTNRHVAVAFTRSAPMSDCGQVIAGPTDLDGFLRALREHAPLARFDLAAAASVVPQV